MNYKQFLLSTACIIVPCSAWAQGTTNINQLPPAVAPLGGSELYPVWQSGATKKIPSYNSLSTVVSGQHNFYGATSASLTCPLSGSSPITIGTTGCPAGSNYGVGFQSVRLASGSQMLACPSGGVVNEQIQLQITQPSTGSPGSLTLSPACFVTASGGVQLTLSSSNNFTDWVFLQALAVGAFPSWFVSQPLQNIAPVQGIEPTVGTNGFGAQCGTGTSCVGASLTVVAGDIVGVYSFACSNNCGVTGAPSVSSVTKAAGTATLGSCVLGGAGNAYITTSGSNIRSEGWSCAVTASGTLTPQANYSTTAYFPVVADVEVQSANGEDLIGNGGDQGSSTSVAVSATAGASYANDLCVSFIEQSGGTAAVTGGQTLIGTGPSGTAMLTQQQNGGAFGALPVATGTGVGGNGEVIGVMVCWHP